MIPVLPGRMASRISVDVSKAKSTGGFPAGTSTAETDARIASATRFPSGNSAKEAFPTGNAVSPTIAVGESGLRASVTMSVKTPTAPSTLSSPRVVSSTESIR